MDRIYMYIVKMPRVRVRGRNARRVPDVRPRRRNANHVPAHDEPEQVVQDVDANLPNPGPPHVQPLDVEAISQEITRNVLQRIQTIQPIQAANINAEQGNTEHANNLQIFSTMHELGYNVQNNVKIKIINNEYIDLGILISKVSNPDDDSKNISIKDGNLVITNKSRPTKITDIQQWTDAMLIFASIYTSAHSLEFSGLLKYIHTVRLGASRTPGLGWKSYDIQFRLKKERNPEKSWAVVDQELWLLYMYANFNTIPNTTTTPSNSMYKCYDYNYKGVCNKLRCSYLHSCIKCSMTHPQLRCRVVKASNINFRSGNQQQQWSSRAAAAATSNGKLDSTNVGKPAQSAKQSRQ